MRTRVGAQLNVAIACGGTGGHLFPGVAVAGQLTRRGASVTLMVSPKEIDQLAVKTVAEMQIVTLPAVGLSRGHWLSFLRGLLQSYRAASRWFRQRPPYAVLAMGGFTSAPPILAARRFQSRTFLHESNSIPGRANRWLSRIVEQAFVGFPSAAQGLHNRCVSVTGTPVRPKFQRIEPGACRVALGLDPVRPVALVMGGSQGAHGVNELILRSLDAMSKLGPDWQWFHLAGAADSEQLRQAYTARGLRATVHSFFAEMELAMGAATASISRAGASSLAELAAMRLPAVLIPFPAATDNHQFHNARAFEQTGAALLLDQQTAGPADLAQAFGALMCQEAVRQGMQAALAKWHTPQAAEQIAQAMLESVGQGAHPARSASVPKAKSFSGDTRTRCAPDLAWRGFRSSRQRVPQPIAEGNVA